MPESTPEDVLASWAEELGAGNTLGTSDESSTSEYSAKACSTDVPLLSAGRPAMACEFEVLLNRGQHPRAVDSAVEALDEVERLENLLSIYKPQSDLATVNRFAHCNPIPVSPDTMRMLQIGQAISKLTGGAFDLTAGKLSTIWGFSRRAGRMPDPAAVEEALKLVGEGHLRLSADDRSVASQVDGLEINPGGIGKGYALDRAGQLMRKASVGDFMLHGGQSSIIAAGDRQNRQTGGGWKVAVRHPLAPDVVLGTVRLRNQALGTSGSGKQFFHFNGRRYSHIIDPRSGYPAEGLLSATVICASGTVADALATALFVMGPLAAAEFLTRLPTSGPMAGVGGILVLPTKGGLGVRLQSFNLSDDAWQRSDSTPQAY